MSISLSGSSMPVASPVEQYKVASAFGGANEAVVITLAADPTLRYRVFGLSWSFSGAALTTSRSTLTVNAVEAWNQIAGASADKDRRNFRLPIVSGLNQAVVLTVPAVPAISGACNLFYEEVTA